ncbi:Fe-S oxidoreductase [Candidatus Magnetobacterium bavaricum]|uniref:Fe-S oxidoreductase n=1 Tax=Candidatus Magnetobacterium bavaricum TaxID=29290 RepID=A0A0F3GHF4_9BACT|nr:Fe-S oxidoreductase [Candidatus Magnetobacterium bavaricum]
MESFAKKLKILSNCCKSIYDYKKKKLISPNLPTLLWIEPTNKCNLKCVMCPNTNIPESDIGFMTWDTYKKIIDEACEFVSSTYLLIGGESLLHKNIYDMIRYARDNDIRPLLNTNATLLISRENRTKLLDSGVVHITFAFDGYNKETYESVRIGAKYDTVLKGVIEFLREKKHRNLKEPFVAITTLDVGMDKYDDKKKARMSFYKLFDGLPVDEFILKTPNTWGGTFSGSSQFRHHKISTSKYQPCSHLWSTMSICWDGTVVPCCFDFLKTYVLGNIHEKSLKEIWNDKPMVNLRKGMLDGTYAQINKLCKGCVIVHLTPIVGIPAGMRTTVKDSLTNIFGIRYEKTFKRIAKMLNSSYSLKVEK